MEVLNDHVRHLSTLNDSPKAVPTTKKGNIPFGEADLAMIVLASVLMSWQKQYYLSHSMVPESTRMLLPDLEAIKQVMVEKHNEKLKATGKAGTAQSKAKSSLKCKASGGLTGQVPEKGCSEKFASIARLTAVPTRPTTPWTAVPMTAMVSPSRQQQVSPLSQRSPSRSLGVIRAWPSCSPCLRLMQKARRKSVSLKA
jgi:hypothetical protein